MKMKTVGIKNLKKSFIIPLCLLALVLGMMVVLQALPVSSFSVNELNKGWQMSQNGNLGEAVELPVTKVDFKGEKKYILEKKLPQDFEQLQTLCIKINLGMLKMYLDGKILYEDNYDKKEALFYLKTHRRLLIDIPEGSAGKILKLEMSSVNQFFSGKFSPIVYGTQQNVLKYVMIHETLLRIIGNILMIFMGFELVTIYLIYHSKMEAKGVLYAGIYLMMTGSWAMSAESGVLSFNPYTHISNYFVIVVLNCCMPLFFLLSYRENIDSADKRKTNFLLCTYVTNLLYTLLANIFFDNFLLECVIPVIAGVVLMVAGGIYILYGNLIQRRLRKAERYAFFYVDNMLVVTVLAGFLAWYVYGFTALLIWYQVGSVVYALWSAYINVMRVVERSKKARRIEAEVQEIKNQAVLNQIRPSFMENTLEMLQELILKKPDQAYELVYNFASFLRYNVDGVDSGNYKHFKDELKNIRNFLHIEGMRIGLGLKVHYQIDAIDFEVPSLSIQLLIEWAVFRSEEVNAPSIEIVIRSYCDKEVYVVEVQENNGVFHGIEDDNGNEEGQILQQVRQRWFYYTGNPVIEKIISEKGSCIMARTADKKGELNLGDGTAYENYIGR